MKPSQIIISIAVIATLAASFWADLNDTHVYNLAWPPHARFHAIVALFVTSGYSLIALWLIWRQSADRFICMAVAALMPFVSWYGHYMAFFLVGPSDTEIVLGLPANLLGGGIIMSVSAIGYFQFRRERRIALDADYGSKR